MYRSTHYRTNFSKFIVYILITTIQFQNSSVIPFHIDKIIQYVEFWFWFLSFSITSQMVACYHQLVPFHCWIHCTARPHFVRLSFQMFPVWRLLWVMLLWNIHLQVLMWTISFLFFFWEEFQESNGWIMWSEYVYLLTHSFPRQLDRFSLLFFMAGLVLRCCAWVLSSCDDRGYASLSCAGFSLQWLLLLQRRALECRLSSCGAGA